MLPTNAYQQYQESQVHTASRGKLLLMAFDGAIRFVRQARIHMAERRYEEQNVNILKAQRIILELMATLDMKASPDLAERLMSLYEYMYNRLVQANVSDDEGALDEVLSMLADMRATWAEAERAVTMSAAETMVDRHVACAA